MQWLGTGQGCISSMCARMTRAGFGSASFQLAPAFKRRSSADSELLGLAQQASARREAPQPTKVSDS